MKNLIETRLSELGIIVPPLAEPIRNYLPFPISGNLLFMSGQAPKTAEGRWICGRVGEHVSVEEPYQHARLTGIRLLAAVKAALGSLDRVRKVVKVLGVVNAAPGFRNHPAVINGCSDLLAEVYGEAGRHARSAIGASSLPEDVTLEIEAVLEVD